MKVLKTSLKLLSSLGKLQNKYIGRAFSNDTLQETCNEGQGCRISSRLFKKQSKKKHLNFHRKFLGFFEQSSLGLPRLVKSIPVCHVHHSHLSRYAFTKKKSAKSYLMEFFHNFLRFLQLSPLGLLRLVKIYRGLLCSPQPSLKAGFHKEKNRQNKVNHLIFLTVFHHFAGIPLGFAAIGKN